MAFGKKITRVKGEKLRHTRKNSDTQENFISREKKFDPRQKRFDPQEKKIDSQEHEPSKTRNPRDHEVGHKRDLADLSKRYPTQMSSLHQLFIFFWAA